METIHVQLTNKRGNIGMLKVLTVVKLAMSIVHTHQWLSLPGGGGGRRRNARENFGEFRGRRHHKAIIGTGPGDEMLNAGILQHTVRVSETCNS